MSSGKRFPKSCARAVSYTHLDVYKRQVSPWGLDKAALSLCAAKVCRLVLAEAVRDEVEENLLLHTERLVSLDAEQLIENYRRLIRLTNPELVPYPDKDCLLYTSRCV